MSLIGALNVGKTALAVQQAALQVTGNNIANTGNADYTRQTARIVPGADQQIRPGMFVGTGINLTAIERQIDEALEQRLRGSMSDAEGADVVQQWLGWVESVFNELSDEDLSTQLSTFFNSWSNLANKPQDIGLRQVVLQNGSSVAKGLGSLRNGLGELQKDVDSRLAALAGTADTLAGQIADLNQQIVVAEGGSGGLANGLRDQRDAVLKRLSQLMDINVVDTGDGMVNVNVGSEPLVAGVINRGVGIRQETTEDGALITAVIIKADNGAMKLTAGQLGALTSVRLRLDEAIADVDALAGNLIFELNKLHSAGQGLVGMTQITGASVVRDPTVALNDQDTGLAAPPANGSFVIHVKQKLTGLVSSTLIKVDLDGLNGNDTTLNSLIAELDAVDGISASLVGGKLRIDSDSTDSEISFSQDSSGVLASLGVNAFFTGKDARDLAISAALKADPRLLAAARNGQPADNQTAIAIAALESTALTGLSGATLKEKYQVIVNGVAVDAQTARTNAEAARVVKDTLQAQREALSGVSMDEEAINLMRQQRAFQAASRLIAAVDEMMQTVLSMV